MDALISVITNRPEWALAIAEAGALVWIARQWAKSINANMELANRFGGAIEAVNLRADAIQRSLERLEARG